MLRYCKCGYPIWVEALFNGLKWVQVLRDHETGRELTFCPGCGQGLEGPEDLVDEPDGAE